MEITIETELRTALIEYINSSNIPISKNEIFLAWQFVNGVLQPHFPATKYDVVDIDAANKDIRNQLSEKELPRLIAGFLTTQEIETATLVFSQLSAIERALNASRHK